MQQNQNPNKVAATEAPRRVISLLVDNHNGVLARVSSLFCRRGFNIDSLTVSETEDPDSSRHQRSGGQPHYRYPAWRRCRHQPADFTDRAAGSDPPGI